jgi:hypothetical protein
MTLQSAVVMIHEFNDYMNRTLRVPNAMKMYKTQVKSTIEVASRSVAVWASSVNLSSISCSTDAF